jgi:hypothetical protein
MGNGMSLMEINGPSKSRQRARILFRMHNFRYRNSKNRLQHSHFQRLHSQTPRSEEIPGRRSVRKI